MNGLKYQITLKVLLNKSKGNKAKNFSPVCFNSATKTATNFEYSLDKSFQKIPYTIVNWINEGSGCG